MPRYIDADALIEDIKRVYCTDCNSYNGVRCKACGTGDALDMVEDAPTADVVPRAEVVRVIEQIKTHIERGVPLVGAQTEYKLGLWFADLKKKYTEERNDARVIQTEI